MYRLRQITPPAGNIVTTEDVREWLSESSMHSDDVINDIIQVATSIIDGEHSHIGETVLPTTWEMSFWSFPDYRDPVRLLLPPITSVDTVEYDSNSGVVKNVSNTFLLNRHGIEYLCCWDDWPTDIKDKPSVEPIRIQYQAGYPNGVPAGIRQCTLAICSHLFDHRSQYQGSGMSATNLDPAIRNILASYDLR